MRTYLGYVPTSDTVQTQIFRFFTTTLRYDQPSIQHSDITIRQHTNNPSKRRDTPQVCPPKSNRRFPPDIFPLPFGHKKSLERFLLRGFKGQRPAPSLFRSSCGATGLGPCAGGKEWNPRASANLFYFFFLFSPFSEIRT